MCFGLFQHEEIKSGNRDIRRLQDEIDKYVSSGKEDHLEKSRREMSQLKSDSEEYEREKEEIFKKITKIQEDAAKQEVLGIGSQFHNVFSNLTSIWGRGSGQFKTEKHI